MKKLVQVENVESEGLLALLGQRVTLFCLNYFYTGKLAGVNDDCVLLEEPSIVFQTGSYSNKTWESSEKLPNDLYVMKGAIEAFGIVK